LKDFKNKLFAEITTIPPILQGSYYLALNGLRGIAILMVLLAHFGVNHFLYPFHLFINSDTGVNIFFVLSGFLITTLLIKEKLKTGKISLTQFYIRRALKILPVAYLFLLVLIALTLIFHLKISCLDFIASFLFFKNFPLANEPYTAHFWTLAVEVQFYILFPWLLVSNFRNYFIIALTIVIIVPVISVLGFYHIAFLYSNPVILSITKAMMYLFWKGPVTILIGSVFAILMFKNVIPVNHAGQNYFLGFVLLLAAIVISTKTFIFYNKYLSEYLTAILTGYVIVLSLNGQSFLALVLKNTTLVWIGIISYSLYMWQELFIGLKGWQAWLHGLYHCPIWGLIIIKLVIIFAIAAASYYFFEQKFLKIKDRCHN
jgi:peptidoglycan/LPS O-acetylase OafA/YrhL